MLFRSSSYQRGRAFSIVCLLCLALCDCGSVLRKKTSKEQRADSPPVAKNEAEAKRVLHEAGKDVVFGDPLGEIGASILFLPYGIYKLGQAAAGAAGYKLEATGALPKEEQQTAKKVGKAIISAPGRAVAAAAGEPYRNEGKIIKDP